MVTAGDRSSAPVHRLGVGVFVSALRDALPAKEIDFAVHSYKDLPTAAADGLHIAAVPAREDPRDALVARDGRTLAELPPGATVGTGALRRIAQLHALGLQLDGRPDPRQRRHPAGRVLGPEGELDAVVLARAGLARLGRVDEITEIARPDADAARARSGRAGGGVPGRRPGPGRAARRARPRTDPRRGHRGTGVAGHPGGRVQRTRSPPTPNSPRATTAMRSTCAGR